jgi:hypothetical protein
LYGLHLICFLDEWAKVTVHHVFFAVERLEELLTQVPVLERPYGGIELVVIKLVQGLWVVKDSAEVRPVPYMGRRELRGCFSSIKALLVDTLRYGRELLDDGLGRPWVC